MKSKKVTKLLFLVAVIAFAGTSVFAKGKISVSPYLKTSYAVISALPSVEELYSVSISNVSGEVVYSSSKVENGAIFTRLFDFSKMEDGEYKVRLKSKNNATIEERFIVKNGTLVSENSIKEVADADVKIWKNNEFVFVSHLNRYLNDMVISLEDERGSVIYNKNLPAELSYSGKFNVSSLPKGNYSLSFVSGNKVFNYDFKK